MAKNDLQRVSVYWPDHDDFNNMLMNGDQVRELVFYKTAGGRMKLEASLKHFSPQGMHISDDVKGTSPDRLTGTDVMAAIGTTSSRARTGGVLR